MHDGGYILKIIPEYLFNEKSDIFGIRSSMTSLVMSV